MRNALVALLSTALSLATVVPFATAQESTWGFPYDSQKVRGVNLGGWLVLEVLYTRSSCMKSPVDASMFLALDHALAV